MLLHFPAWKKYLVIAIALLGLLGSIPTFIDRGWYENNWPNWLPGKPISYGLDLQGGSHLLLEMEADKLMKKWIESVRADVRDKLWKQEKIAHQAKISGEKIILRVRKPENQEKALKKLRETIIQPLDNSILGGANQVKNLDMEVKADGQIILAPSSQARDRRITNAVGFAIETVGRRINALGTSEPLVQRQGKQRILVQVPGFNKPEELKSLLGKTGSLSFQLVDHSVDQAQAGTARVPFGSERLFEEENGVQTPIILKKRIIVSGEDLENAKQGYDDRDGETVVTFRFNHRGALKFGQVTKENVNKRFAIVLDDRVISAPVINEPILGGSGQISGNFTVKEATEMAILMRSGALPAPLTIVEERTVGATLGQDSVDAGFWAGLLGLGLVIGFILFTYGQFGLYANVALMVNIGLIITVLSTFGAVLTLPGIAGIVLTMGMAVDANVLIFERIREELRAGKLPIKAIENGYAKALGTILDANITTLIAAAILFWLGSGPVKGFAVTLSVGILTSVFTAFTVTRLIVSLWVASHKGKPKAVPI